ncbi:hypothetical protein [Bradyrhizobium cajani]|uniref:Uncharacterized protein n=1 Tax=Bradyrhizobium cajani TaxID=1928661 RepID=A0A844T5L6_9BRAD|nr:hypothetical protein [Bradyrhizobium cajani]MCP3370374.1 hypothetical protein [Bradyrhizobium cajani]MVT72905.1 hypothetical protein [Bradyrhizobium cajani]
MSEEKRAAAECRDEVAAPTDPPTSGGPQAKQPAVRPFDTIVFCGDAEQVRSGFALALGALEVRDDLLLIDWTNN